MGPTLAWLLMTTFVELCRMSRIIDSLVLIWLVEVTLLFLLQSKHVKAPLMMDLSTQSEQRA
jgi:hypothetical protein